MIAVHRWGTTIGFMEIYTCPNLMVLYMCYHQLRRGRIELRWSLNLVDTYGRIKSIYASYMKGPIRCQLYHWIIG